MNLDDIDIDKLPAEVRAQYKLLQLDVSHCRKRRFNDKAKR